MHYKYTNKQFKQYVKYCKYWVNKFGITEYDIDYKHHKFESAARTTYDCKAKLACFQLTTKGEGDYCFQSDLNKLALHEVIHLLLADFGNTIHETKDSNSDLAIAQEHQVVMRLIKVLL